MATTTVGSVVFQISADIRDIQGQLRTLESSFQGTFNRISNTVRSFAGVFGVGLGAGALVNFGRSAITAVGHIQDIAEQTGFAASTLSSLKTVLEQNGSSLDAFANAMFNAQKEIGAIKNVSDPALQTIKDLGLKFEDLRQSTPEEFAKKVADALNAIEDPQKRAALGAQLLGRSYREVAPALNEMARNLDKLKKEGLTDEQIKRIDEFGDAWERVKNKLIFFAAEGILRIVDNLHKLRDAMESIGIVGARPRPQAGEFGTDITQFPGRPIRPAPAGALQDKDTENKIKSLTDTFEKQIRILQADAMAFTEGEEAALRFKLAQQVTDEVGKKALSTFQKQIDLIVELTMAQKEREAAEKRFNAIQKEIQEQLNLEQNLQKEANKELEERIQLLKEVGDAELRAKQEAAAARERTIENLQRAKEISVSLMPEGTEKRVAEVTLEFDKQRQLLKGWLAVVDEGSLEAKKFQAALDDLGNAQARALDKLEPAMQVFETLETSISDAIQTALDGVIQGTQTLGDAMRNMARSIMLQFSHELNKQFVIQPIFKILSQFLGAGLASMAGPITGATGTLNPTFSIAGPGQGFAAVPFMQTGGIVPGPRGRAVPIIAHAGEEVIPVGRNGGGPKVSVNINGDVIPRTPGMTKAEVIQIGIDQFDNRGAWMNMVEQRQSPRR